MPVDRKLHLLVHGRITMPPTLKQLGRYRDIAWFLAKYGRSDLVRRAGLATDNDSPAPQSAPDGGPSPADLASDLEAMGPTFIKLGQLLSTRADLLPPAYLDALSRLQDKLEPFPFEEVEAIVHTELGVRLSKGFAEFEATPVAAASLGQVHRAVLRSGLAVAVKVQRPGIRERALSDLDALEDVAGMAERHSATGRDFEPTRFIEEFRKTLLAELDYRREARHLSMFRERLSGFTRIVIPAPVNEYTTSRVLTMDYILGTKLTKLSPLVRLDAAGRRLADELFGAYLHQILIDGTFHADPHPGNVFLTDDHRIALLDLGMVGRIPPKMQTSLFKLLLAVGDAQGDDAAAAAVELSVRSERFDEEAYRRKVAETVGRYQSAPLKDLNVGRVVLEMTRAGGEHGLMMAPELSLLGKTLLNLDEIGRRLDPGFDVNDSIRRHASELMRRHLTKSIAPGHVFASLLEVKDFVEALPARVNRLLDAVVRSELKVNVEVIDQGSILDGLQKVANRIAVGLVLAALIVGAALLMQVSTPFTILGYPGFAMALFLAAAAGGIWMAVTILRGDVRSGAIRSPRRKKSG
jgi:predicted unusual protein kinase regulating ubiquinone biosynthesis (AarF/ABC1/UbiB family)